MDLNEGLLELQQINKKHPLILVGSGLSASMKIPGMMQLQAWLSTEVPKRISSSGQLREWHRSEKAIKKHGLEQGLAEHPVPDRLLEIIVDETYSLVAEHDAALRMQLVTDRSSVDFPFADLLKHLFQSLSPNQPTLDIVTSNYDLIIEYACDIIGAECVTGFAGEEIQKFYPRLLTEERYIYPPLAKAAPKRICRVRLLKPHGSLRWWQNDQFTIQYRHDPGNSYTHAMITPGTTKYQRSLVQLVLNQHRELANERMRQANAFIIIGYGFNDDHLQTVLWERMQHVPCVILTHTLSDRAKAFVDRCPRTLALEADAGHDDRTRWYHATQSGIWEIPMWDLGTYVRNVIG